MGYAKPPMIKLGQLRESYVYFKVQTECKMGLACKYTGTATEITLCGDNLTLSV